jgi:flavodoxin
MKKTIVVYYSRKGSNLYLAEKIANRLNCDIERIRPRMNVFLLFLMKINFGNWRIKHNIKEYDRVILCGPIWMGSLIPPLRSFITRYFKRINQMVFVTCCGSSYEKKDEKFGHGFVFKEVEDLMQGKCMLCQAFPVVMVLPEDKREDPNTFLKTHLNDENFVGEIQERFENFMRIYGNLNEV